MHLVQQKYHVFYLTTVSFLGARYVCLIFAFICSLTRTQQVVKEALADNFNTPDMMAAILNLVHACNIELCKTTASKVCVRLTSTMTLY